VSYQELNKEAAHAVMEQLLSAGRTRLGLILVDAGRGDFGRLLRHGFTPEEILIVTKDPSVLSRFLVDDLTTVETAAVQDHCFGGMLSAAGNYFAQEMPHSVDAALIDLCSSVGKITRDELHALLTSNLLAGTTRIAINISCRHQKVIPNTDEGRRQWLQSVIVDAGWNAVEVTGGKYFNRDTATRMMWTVYDISC
jgi:hypothetical protein